MTFTTSKYLGKGKKAVNTEGKEKYSGNRSQHNPERNFFFPEEKKNKCERVEIEAGIEERAWRSQKDLSTKLPVYIVYDIQDYCWTAQQCLNYPTKRAYSPHMFFLSSLSSPLDFVLTGSKRKRVSNFTQKLRAILLETKIDVRLIA